MERYIYILTANTLAISLARLNLWLLNAPKTTWHHIVLSFQLRSFVWHPSLSEPFLKTNLEATATRGHGYMVQCSVHVTLAMLEREYARTLYYSVSSPSSGNNK